jgi:hypothetical protein
MASTETAASNFSGASRYCFRLLLGMAVTTKIDNCDLRHSRFPVSGVPEIDRQSLAAPHIEDWALWRDLLAQSCAF